jgi:hypothetical protein
VVLVATSVTDPAGGDTKLGSAEGGATLDSKFPSFAVLFNGSTEDDDVELLRDSNDIKITYFSTTSKRNSCMSLDIN